ncbi:MAG: hypothetical protein ACD_62C00622G0002 [uncultured bacterium]|nr:MAG: hypothetical protein ACD_62C00622G0002 [uncultured bacterium]
MADQSTEHRKIGGYYSKQQTTPRGEKAISPQD